MSMDSSGQPEAVEFYWRPGCPFCAMLRRSLRRSGLPRTEVNIWDDAQAAARVRAATGGNETVPTVFIGQQALVNPSMRQVEDTVREHAPQLFNKARAPRGWRARLFGRDW